MQGIATFVPLDLFKFGVCYALSGKAWDNLFENKIAFTSKKDYGRKEREAQWATAQRMLHGLTTSETDSAAERSTGHGELSAMAGQAKRRAEMARLREFNALPGRVESVARLKGLGMDQAVNHHLTI